MYGADCLPDMNNLSVGDAGVEDNLYGNIGMFVLYVASVPKKNRMKFESIQSISKQIQTKFKPYLELGGSSLF